MKDKNQGFIDRIFLHGKNADERLFDLILRSLTFIVLLLFLVLYCSLNVHADSGSTLMALFNIDSNKLNPDYVPSGNYSNNRAFFNSYDFGYAVQNYSILSDAFLSMGTSGDPTNFHPPYSWDSNSEPLDFSGVDIDNNFIICCSNYFSGIGRMNGYIAIPKQLFLDGKVMFCRSGNIYATESFEYQISSTWQALTTRIFTADGSAHVIDLQQALTTGNCYFCSCPFWDGIGFVNDFSASCNDVLAHNNDPFYYTSTFCNMNYFMYDDVSNMSASLIPEVESESNLNHLVLEDCQIGLISSGAKSELSASSVVIGVDVDNWIKNHPDQFYLQVKYQFDFHGTFDGNNMPLNGSYSTTQIHPIKTFTNDAYTYGLSRLAQDAEFNYGALKNTYGYTVESGTPYSGIFPTLKNFVSKTVSDVFGVNQSTNVGHTSTIDTFSLTVTVNLFDFTHQDNNMSGGYTKVFDFINGNSSITDAKIFQNPNPWTGEGDPQYNPIVPSGGGGNGSAVPSSGGGYNDIDIDIKNGSGYKDTELHQLTEDDIKTNHQNIIRTFQSIKEAFQYMYDESKEDGFIQFTSETIGNLPFINILIACLTVLFGVAVVTFFVKRVL